MKKKVVAITTALALCILCVLNVFAASSKVDVSVFKNDENFTVSEDEMTGDITISMSKIENLRFTHSNSYKKYSFITPCIIIDDYGTENENTTFSLFIYYYAENWLFADSAIVKIGNNRYNISDIDILQKQEVLKDGEILEGLLINVDYSDQSMMQDWVSSKDDIKIRLSGSKGSVDITLPKAARDTIAHAYNRFVQSGCSAKGVLSTTELTPIKLVKNNKTNTTAK